MAKRLRIVLATTGTNPEQELFNALPILSGSEELRIEGVFVRDTSLLRAAALPFTREVLHGGVVRELSHQRTSDQLTFAAARVRDLLAELARRLNIQTSFIELEGFESSDLNTIVNAADFVVVARSGWPKSLRSRRAYRALPLVTHNKTTLFVNEPWGSGRCVVAAYDGDSSLRALRVASRYAEAAGLPLVVATLKSAQLPEDAHSSALEQVHLRATASADLTDQLAQLVEERDARLLVLENTVTDNWLELLPRLFDRVPCSVLHLSDEPSS